MTRWMVILAILVVPGVVCAQGTMQSWPELDVTALPTVYVRDDAGGETVGRLLRIDSDALVLQVDGSERRFEAARVTRIQKRGDSLRNGAIIGALVGAGIGVFAAGIADCPGSHRGGECPGARVAGFLGATVVYAGIGAGIDALVVGRTTVYEVPAAQTRSTRGPSRRGAALNLSFRW